MIIVGGKVDNDSCNFSQKIIWCSAEGRAPTYYRAQWHKSAANLVEITNHGSGIKYL